MGIAGVEYRLVVAAEAGLQGRRGDVVDGGIAAHILEHVHLLPEYKLGGVLVELDRLGQVREQTQKKKKTVAHAAPQWPDA
ncbi:hypothetical protein GCM10017655_45840 [Pseudomonas turukhanskensis]|uniref:Uncharacterized protein n=1 Tax=Pseudomonas turukhanskensis TaxID=1806536 RepID=A0A9W6KC69_9PSED|nr:hypothetical protein GCM10017655_45840 [Pseudomonas turukhanskensis]